jgi:hypothetical protein
MATDALVKIDEVKWHITQTSSGRVPVPLCPKHNLRLQPTSYGIVSLSAYNSKELKCEDCPELHKIPRGLEDEKRYVLNKIDSRTFRQMKMINFDEQFVPIAVERGEPEDSPYWVEVKLFKSETGPKFVIYAGQKGLEGKSQVFVDPETRRMGFDQSDRHPGDVFVSIEATFKDGTKTKISSD